MQNDPVAGLAVNNVFNTCRSIWLVTAATFDDPDDARMGRKPRPHFPPDPNTRNWTARRKAGVVQAFARDLITKPEACALYAMAPEELEAWLRRYRTDGLNGLKQGR